MSGNREKRQYSLATPIFRLLRSGLGENDVSSTDLSFGLYESLQINADTVKIVIRGKEKVRSTEIPRASVKLAGMPIVANGNGPSVLPPAIVANRKLLTAGELLISTKFELASIPTSPIVCGPFELLATEAKRITVCPGVTVCTGLLRGAPTGRHVYQLDSSRR